PSKLGRIRRTKGWSAPGPRGRPRRPKGPRHVLRAQSRRQGRPSQKRPVHDVLASYRLQPASSSAIVAPVWRVTTSPASPVVAWVIVPNTWSLAYPKPERGRDRHPASGHTGVSPAGRMAAVLEPPSSAAVGSFAARDRATIVAASFGGGSLRLRYSVRRVPTRFTRTRTRTFSSSLPSRQRTP